MADRESPLLKTDHALPPAGAPPIAVVARDTAFRSRLEAASAGAAPARATAKGAIPASANGFAVVASVLGSEDFEATMGPIARLYLALFKRLPDYEGFQWYVDERDGGRALTAIADEFAASREFTMRYGDVDNAGFLDRMARNVFEGGIDPAQRAHWLAQLESGAMTRGEVMLALAESSGFRVATDNEVFVAIAYAETLQRAPEVADWERWVTLLDAGHPRAALIEELLRKRTVQ